MPAGGLWKRALGAVGLILLAILVVLGGFIYRLLVPQSMSTTIPDETPSGILITNATLFTGNEPTPVENASIVIEQDGTIRDVTTETVATDGQYVIDAEGKFVMPGLVETHAHLFFDFDQLILYQSRPNSDEEARAYMAGPMQEKFADYLSEGFTTIVTPGDFFPHIVEIKEQIRNGEISGPRLFVAGGIFTAPGEHPSSTICGNEAWCGIHLSAQVDSIEGARQKVQEYAQGGVDFLKITYQSDNDATLLPPEIVQAIIDEAHKAGIRAFAHVSDTNLLPDFVEWGIDGFVHPTDGGVENFAEFHKPAAERGMPMSITTSDPIGLFTDYLGFTNALNASEPTGQSADIASFWAQGGIPVMGTDLPGFSVWSAKMIGVRSLKRLGMENYQVLQAMTKFAAQDMLQQPNLGTIEPDQLADIVIINGNPLENLDDLAQVQMVIQNGKLVVDKR